MRVFSAAAAAAAAAAKATNVSRLAAAMHAGQRVPLISRTGSLPRLYAELVTLINKAVAPGLTLEERVNAVDNLFVAVAKRTYDIADFLGQPNDKWTMHETLTTSTFIARMHELGTSRASRDGPCPYRETQAVHTYRQQDRAWRLALPGAFLSSPTTSMTPHAVLAAMIPQPPQQQQQSEAWGFEFTHPAVPFSMDALMGRLLYTREAQQLLPKNLREEAFLSHEHLHIALQDLLSMLNRRIVLSVCEIDAMLARDDEAQSVSLRFLRECSHHPNVTVLASYRCPEKDYLALTAPDCVSAMYDADVRKRYPSCWAFTGSPIVNPLYGRAPFFRHL